MNQTVQLITSQGGISRQDVRDAVVQCQQAKGDCAHLIVHHNQLYVAGSFPGFQSRLESVLLLLQQAIYFHSSHGPIPDSEFVIGTADYPLIEIRGAWNIIRSKEQRSNFVMPNFIFYQSAEGHLRPWRKILDAISSKERGRSFLSKPLAKMFWKGGFRNELRQVRRFLKLNAHIDAKM